MDNETFVYRDARMAEIAALARRAACGTANILIEGAPGTGRSALARWIAANGGAGAPALRAVHCGGGGGQVRWHDLTAQNGTLLLADVCELDGRAQAELALALGFGGRGPRIIATSARDLAEAAADGAFRQDLFFRLAVVRVQLPRLAERSDDLPALAEHFAARFAQAHRLPRRSLADDALAALAAHDWPGNVQELANVIERAAVFADGDAITAADIRFCNGSRERDLASSSLVGRRVADVERDLILQTLRHCGGNRTRSADILGISVRTLRNKMKQYLDEGRSVPLRQAC